MITELVFNSMKNQHTHTHIHAIITNTIIISQDN